jgi:Transglycosylase SLT domain
VIAVRRGLGSTTYNSQILSAIPTYCPSCPPNLVLSLVQQESGGNQYGPSGAPLVGSSGDTGLFQIIPSTAAGLNIDATTPSGNIQGGLTLLQQLYNQYGNWTDALEAYNEGSGNLAKQTAAGQTPTSAGYASSILTAAGISDSSSLPSDSDDSGTVDSLDLSSLVPSIDLSALTDLPDTTGLSWPVMALIGVAVLGTAYALS